MARLRLLRVWTVAHPGTAHTLLNVVRFRSKVASLVAIAIAFCMVGLELLSAPRHRISVGVLSYEPWGGTAPDLMVRVGITNTGFKAIRYNQGNFDGGGCLITESQRGWTNRGIGPGEGLPYLPALLASGSSTWAFLLLPEGTTRWQVRYGVRTASLRETVRWRIPATWRSSRLWLFFGRILSNREGRGEEVRSPVFECPHNFSVERMAAGGTGSPIRALVARRHRSPRRWPHQNMKVLTTSVVSLLVGYGVGCCFGYWYCDRCTTNKAVAQAVQGTEMSAALQSVHQRTHYCDDAEPDLSLAWLIGPPAYHQGPSSTR
jgi:regulation of enolase protein 1 (concanavalin A-like superfamily)